MTVTPVAPAPDSTAPAGDAPPEAPAPPAPTPVDPPAAPVTPEPPDEPPLTSVADLGDGPDGDHVPGETREDQLKRIARRADKERIAAESERDELRSKVEAAQTISAEAAATAERLTQAETKVGQLTESLDTATLALLKYEVGSQAGLTLAQSKRLMGTTKEELVEDTRRYIADNGIPGVGSDGEQRRLPDDKESRQAFVEKMRRRR